MPIAHCTHCASCTYIQYKRVIYYTIVMDLQCIRILTDATAAGAIMLLTARQVRMAPLWWRSRFRISRSFMTTSSALPPFPPILCPLSILCDWKDPSIKKALSRHHVTLGDGRPLVDTQRSFKKSPKVKGPISITAKMRNKCTYEIGMYYS